MNRRQFLKRASAAALPVVLAPGSAYAPATASRGHASRLIRGGRFRQGVLAGDPSAHGIPLPPVLDDVGGPGAVPRGGARDPHFPNVVARRTLTASERSGHAVKARVKG